MPRPRTVASIAVSILLAAAASASAIQGGGDLRVHPSRLLVKVKKGAKAEEIAAAHVRVGAKVLQDLPQIGWQVVEVKPGRNFTAQEAYGHEPSIERADLDHARKVASTPNDPYWPYEWHMVDITADQAWNTEKGDPSVVVAVMDTGLDHTHPDLSPNAWTNPGETPGNGIDDDGNGYVDDVYGWDFAYGDNDPNDNYGHGTACAGIVAAAQDNSIGMSGVAPNCKLVGIKAANDSGYFYDSANVPAFLYIADMGFNVVSMSFFADQVTPAERDAVDYCWSKNVVLVAAAGNDTRVMPYYPGAYEHVISVAATDGADNRTWFSNYGSWVDVAAPGVSLVATVPGGGYTTGFAGTSGATPHVAGLAALLFSAKPGATNAEVRAALEDTAHATFDANLGEYTNYGRIDCKAAVDRILGVTSGSVAPRLLFASPVGGDLKLLGKLHPGAMRWPPIRFWGAGLEQPNTVRVLYDGSPLALLSQQRQVVAALAPLQGDGQPHSGPVRLDLEVNGNVVGGFDWTNERGLIYVPSDLGNSNANVIGGFDQIVRVDKHHITYDAQNNTISLDVPIHKI